MSQLFDAMYHHALERGDNIAISGQDTALTYADLPSLIEDLQHLMHIQADDRVGLLVDNTPSALLMDLACVAQSCLTIPVPLFFTPNQVLHALQDSGATLLFSNLGEQAEVLLTSAGIAFEALAPIQMAGESIVGFRLLQSQTVSIASDIHKITYTSGSTGEPKGVCLKLAVMETVVQSLFKATQANASDRHVCLLPYATLLENIAGMYVPLLAGARIHLPSLAGVGMQGASGLDIPRFVQALYGSQATTCVMIPQMLQALLAGMASGLPKPSHLRLIAVGGAPVSPSLLQQAKALGLPVYEGYGLSEACSVVALNTPQSHCEGTVGKILPHAKVDIAEDGEIYVSGALFSGYLGDGTEDIQRYATGDIGYVDEAGFLHLKGRKKHIFITSFGRNVSPEWVESEMTIEPAIAQCCVFGEAKPFNVAVIYPRQGFAQDAVAQAVEHANMRLPDYARVKRWVIADEPFSVENGLWTGTGRPRRLMIAKAYQAAMDELYMEET